MDLQEQQFWQVIDNALKQAKHDKKLLAKNIIENLSLKSKDEIIQFEIQLRKLIIKADHFHLMAIQKVVQGWVTDDSYLYFRCWLISLGSKLFYKTLKAPDASANIITKRNFLFEELIYLSTVAFKNKTGKTEEDESFPRNIASLKGFNYDFGAPPTKGEDWDEDDLPKIVPNLYQKFWQE